MKIDNIEVIPVELPLVREHKMAYSHGERIGRFCVVKVETDEGITGWGEAPTEVKWGGDHGTYYGESQKTTIHIIKDYLEPVLKGMICFQIELIQQKMDEQVKGYPYAKAAIEMALFDIVGKSAKLPVHQLLFGPVRERVPVQHSIGLMSPEDAALEAGQVVEEGIRTLKLKIGVDPDRDVKTVREVREAVGPDIQIRVDGNRGYPSVHEAIKVIRRMEPFDLLLVEQPVEGLRAMAQLAASIDTPLMADEGAWSPQDVLSIYEMQAAQMLNVYITKPGGLIKAKRLVHTASALGIRCGVGGMVEMGIGTAANLHFVASSPEVTLACGLSVPYPTDTGRKSRLACSKYKDTLEMDPPEFKDGCLSVPKGPGLGIEIDEKKVAKYRV